MENNFTPVEWLHKKHIHINWLRNRDEISASEADKLRQRAVLEALLMEGREIVKYCNQPELVKVYDPIDPKSTIKSEILDAYNAGYEDATCNHINDAEQYYHQKYNYDSSRKS